MLEQLDNVKCVKEVSKKLPSCEHSARMPCHRDPSTYVCRETCNGAMDCCSKKCTSKCSDCQEISRASAAVPIPDSRPIQRAKHKPHPCERTLYCQHLCLLDCHPKDAGCNPQCKQSCRQECTHRKCPHLCSTPCSPCMEACAWSCPHYSCPVSCGSVSHSIPLNKVSSAQ